MTVAYQPLTPDAPEPARVPVNINADVYAEGTFELPVPAEVAEAIKNAQDAGQAIAEHDLVAVRSDWAAQLRAATATPAATLADPRATTRERDLALAQLDAATAPLLAGRRALLDTIQRKADEELADLPNHRATDADLLKADELVRQLQVLTPRYALPVLRRALITNPLKTGQFGFVHQMLPILRSLYEREGSGYTGSPELMVLLNDAEVATRDARWYAAHKKRWAVARARFQLDTLAEELRQTGGRLDESGYFRLGFFKDVGLTYVPPTPKHEVGA